MPREIQTQVAPEVVHNESLLYNHVAKLFHVSIDDIQKVVIIKRSIDARQKAIKFNIKASVYFLGEAIVEQKIALPKGGLKAYFTIGELVKKFNNQ